MGVGTLPAYSEISLIRPNSTPTWRISQISDTYESIAPPQEHNAPRSISSVFQDLSILAFTPSPPTNLSLQPLLELSIGALLFILHSVVVA